MEISRDRIQGTVGLKSRYVSGQNPSVYKVMVNTFSYTVFIVFKDLVAPPDCFIWPRNAAWVDHKAAT